MIHRDKHKANFTRISNEALRDTTLSDGARSLLFYILSMSDKWTFSVRGLASQFGVTKNTLDARIIELKEKGYIETQSTKGKNGRFESCVWEIYETPRPKNTASQKNGVPKLRDTEKTGSRKIGTIRTINIKEQSNIEELSKGKKAPAQKCQLGCYENVFLTNDEQKELCDRFEFSTVVEYIDRLSSYLHNNPDKHYINHKATIEAWIKQDEGREAT